VRQMLMIMIPKILANPAMLAAFGGAAARPAPSVQSKPNPFGQQTGAGMQGGYTNPNSMGGNTMGGNMGGTAMGMGGQAMGMGGQAMGMGGPPMGPPMGYQYGFPYGTSEWRGRGHISISKYDIPFSFRGLLP